MTYYNTTHEKSKPLEASWARTAKQDALILLIFTKNKKSIFTPFEVQELLSSNFNRVLPITSVRRAINTLTKIGALSKTNIKRKGVYGKVNYCWTHKD